MLTKQQSKGKWNEATEKLRKFLSRAPILVSQQPVICSDGSKGIYITNEETGIKRYFKFDPYIEVKQWIFNIKQDLLSDYPRILEPVYTEYELSPKEIAVLIETGKYKLTDAIPTHVKKLVKYNCWRIDKVQIYKNMFVLSAEGEIDVNTMSLINEDKKQNVRYKYDGPSAIFMNKYRSGDFAADGVSLENSKQYKAGVYFFNRAAFVDEKVVRED